MSPQDDKPLISAQAGPIISAIATVAATLLVWLAQYVVQIDARIDRVEQELNHLIDKNGEVRPSQTAVKAINDLGRLQVRVEGLEKRLGMKFK